MGAPTAPGPYGPGAALGPTDPTGPRCLLWPLAAAAAAAAAGVWRERTLQGAADGHSKEPPTDTRLEKKVQNFKIAGATDKKKGQN